MIVGCYTSPSVASLRRRVSHSSQESLERQKPAIRRGLSPDIALLTCTVAGSRTSSPKAAPYRNNGRMHDTLCILLAEDLQRHISRPNTRVPCPALQMHRAGAARLVTDCKPHSIGSRYSFHRGRSLVRLQCMSGPRIGRWPAMLGDAS